MNLTNKMSVALRKESVDRNFGNAVTWANPYFVALRKESVDRNKVKVCTIAITSCRSPQGERG